MSLINVRVLSFKFLVDRWDVFVYGGGCPHASQVCCDTPPFLGKDIPILSLLFLRGGGGGVDGGLGLGYTRRGSPDSKVSLREASQYTRLGSLSDE